MTLRLVPVHNDATVDFAEFRATSGDLTCCEMQQ